MLFSIKKDALILNCVHGFTLGKGRRKAVEEVRHGLRRHTDDGVSGEHYIKMYGGRSTRHKRR